MPTQAQNEWLGRALGVTVRSNPAQSAHQATAEPVPPDLMQGVGRSLTSMLGPQGLEALSDSARRALDALKQRYKPIETEMTALMAELDRDDLGDQDRNIALDRLGTLQGELQEHVSAVEAALG